MVKFKDFAENVCANKTLKNVVGNWANVIMQKVYIYNENRNWENIFKYHFCFFEGEGGRIKCMPAALDDFV